MKLLKWIQRNYSAVIVPMVFILLMTVDVVIASSGGGGEHGGGHSAGGWVATDTYRVMNFAVLAIALFFLLKKPVAQFLNDRIQSIQEQLDDLEAQKTEAEKKLAEYEKNLSTLSNESEKIIDQYKQQGIALKEKIIDEASSAAEKLEEQARRTIKHEFKQARQQLEGEVFEKAIAKAEEKLKKSITDQDQNKLVDEYLTKVVTK
jgi:F-type H+-transporting ATPase subunit b